MTATCQTCREGLPVTSFPTIYRRPAERNLAECRDCRDARYALQREIRAAVAEVLDTVDWDAVDWDDVARRIATGDFVTDADEEEVPIAA